MADQNERGRRRGRRERKTAPNPALQEKIREGLGLRPDQRASFVQLGLDDPLDLRREVRLETVTPFPIDDAHPVFVGRGYAVSGTIDVSRGGTVTLSTLPTMRSGIATIEFDNVTPEESDGFRVFKGGVVGVVVGIRGDRGGAFIGKVADELGTLPPVEPIAPPPPPTVPRRRR